MRGPAARPLALAIAIAFALACAAAFAPAGESAAKEKPPAAKTSPAPKPASGAKRPGGLPFEASKGDTLTPDEENAVKGVLYDYLSSIKARDFLRAGGHIDEPSFYALTDTMVREASGDTLPADEVRRALFGTASREELLKRPVPQLFASLIAASEAANPGAFGAVADAQIDVLAVRRVDDHVVIAYQLTIPGAGPEGQPVSHVTAETMRAGSQGWKIVFRR
jgi:hypothetical protein